MDVDKPFSRASPYREPSPQRVNATTMSHYERLSSEAQLRRRLTQDRFVSANQQRLHRLRECLLPRQSGFIDVLPLLFHTNHPLLPGYVSQNAPAGISDYQPSDPSVKAAQKIAKSFALDRRAMHRFDILGIYFMGSTGTIAHSSGSDFDVWLAHASDVGPEAVEGLRRKAQAIEEWAKTLNLEVHFFVFDAARFRDGEHLGLSRDSSGSAQHHLLLDEFYRSCLVVAGLYPVWFQVPPEDERQYADYVAWLRTRSLDADSHYVDFGGLPRIPAEEFFGATLWQLYKSIDSPYKSVLKLLLMEVYASEYPVIDLLSLRYKRAVYSGETDLNALDPYLAMYRRVEEYLIQREDWMRLNLVRRCFYLKLDLKLSEAPTSKDGHWRRDLIGNIVATWGWDEEHIRRLDERALWKLSTVVDERRDLVGAIRQSYRMLSQFARRNAEISRISKTDLNVLGRKLYAAFERKPGKIERLNRGIAPSLLETQVSLQRLTEAGPQENWVLVRGLVPAEGIGGHPPLKRASGVMEMLSWCYFNRILDPSCHIAVHANGSDLTAREVQATLQTLERLFPAAESEAATSEDLIQAPGIRTAALFVNVGIDPMKSEVVNGTQVARSRSNTLSYGGLQKDLAFDLLLVNTWDEIFSFRYLGVRGLLDCICEYLRWAPRTQELVVPAPIRVHCFSSGYGTLVRTTLESLFRDVVRCFYSEPRPGLARYVLEVETSYYLIEAIGDSFRHEELASYPALLRCLAAPASGFCSTVIDRNSLGATLLPLLFDANQPDVIQLVFDVIGQNAEVCVLDERGALFHQTIPYYDSDTLLHHFMLFFEAIDRKKHMLVQNTLVPSIDPAVRFYSVVEGTDGQRRLQEHACLFDPSVTRYFSVHVIIRVNDTHDKVFTIYCNDREFSSLDLGNALFKTVAAHVIEQRKSGLAYPIYITDIDIARELLEHHDKDALRTIQYLGYKKAIEERLNLALREL